MRKVYLALLLTLCPIILPRVRTPYPGPLSYGDFRVYYVAATLAREHRGDSIYSGAKKNEDRQLEGADPNSTFGTTATKVGLDSVSLYLYPPTLADLLIPITLLRYDMATHAWSAFSLLLILTSSFFLVRLMRIRSVGLATICLTVILLCSTPVIRCLFDGQVTILLFALWTSGIYFYRIGWLKTSAFVLALATAIKLTPLIVIVPFLIWRQWKWLGAFAISLATCGIAMCFVNGPNTLVDYAHNILPPMSRAVPEIRNWSVPSYVQLLYIARHNGPLLSPPGTTLATNSLMTFVGKVCSALVLLLSVIPIYRRGQGMKSDDRNMTLALFAMLSPAIAPVSWLNAYVVCLVGLCLLWADAFQNKLANVRLAFLTLGSIALTSFVIPAVSHASLAQNAPPVLTVVLASLMPLAAILLVLDKLIAVGQTSDIAMEPLHSISALST